MKKIILLLIITTISFRSTYAQSKNLPNIKVRTLDGETINIQDIDNNDKNIVISFWATWCKPCKKELNNIAELYENWQDETGVKLIAISIDDSRSMSKVAPYVNSSDWESGWDEINYLEPSKLIDNISEVKTTELSYPSSDSGLTIPITKNNIRPWFEKN